MFKLLSPSGFIARQSRPSNVCFRPLLEQMEERNCPSGSPVGTADFFDQPQDGVITGNVLSNDSDADGDTLTATLIQAPANGTVAFDSSGEFTYTPNENFVGPDTFVYEVSDGTDTDITVVTVDDIAPIMTLSHVMGDENYVTVSGTVTDAQPAGLTVYINGVITTTVVTDAAGNFTTTVIASDLGLFSAVVTDEGGLTSDPVYDTLSSDVPVIYDFAATLNYGNVWTFSGRVEDESPAGLTIQFGGISLLIGQSTTVLADGTFTFDIELPSGNYGNATASVIDWWGLQSDLAVCFVPNH